MHTPSKLLAAAAITTTAWLVPVAPGGAGDLPEPLTVTGEATCISSTEVQVTWSAQNTDLQEGLWSITGAQVITHGNQAVAMSPTLLFPGDTATGASTLPEGPGSATLQVDAVRTFTAESAPSDRQSLIIPSYGSVRLPECPDPTTTTTTPPTTVPPTLSPPTSESTTTTAPPAAAPVSVTPTYTG